MLLIRKSARIGRSKEALEKQMKFWRFFFLWQTFLKNTLQVLRTFLMKG